MAEEKKKNRHEFTPEQRSRGGKTRAAQPSFIDMCENGYAIASALHPKIREKVANYYKAKQGSV